MGIRFGSDLFSGLFYTENNHVSKTRKILNEGIASLTILKTDAEAGPRLMTDPESIMAVYSGF